MKAMKKKKAEFGDFQTPPWFASEVCALLAREGIAPVSLLEPTCGMGHFMMAALRTFGTVQTAVGLEINPTYVETLKQEVLTSPYNTKTEIVQADFFTADWQTLLAKLPDPLLIIGNPPWITSAGLAILGSNNLPPKSNFQNQSGIEAITGASNFDISEWMLRRMTDWILARPGIVAMLCKTAVARKLLLHLWQTNNAGTPQIRLFDAQLVFGAAVDACLFVYDTTQVTANQSCPVYTDLSSDFSVSKIGYRNGRLVANTQLFDRWRHLESNGQSVFRWRSGIKHDCASVMELRPISGDYINNLGEMVELEDTHLYPMLKSSDIAGSDPGQISRWMLVTQQEVGENTRLLKQLSPKTWRYLEEHAELLDGRKSAIYHQRPRFSIFGVGNYTFAPWKVAISGLYKQLDFVVVGTHNGKPIVLDDTCYFLPCQSQTEANLLADLLNSEPARQFYESLIFWDAKRAITAKILARLDLIALADELDRRQELEQTSQTTPSSLPRQLTLLEIGD
jgi:hypothetical protein